MQGAFLGWSVLGYGSYGMVLSAGIFRQMLCPWQQTNKVDITSVSILQMRTLRLREKGSDLPEDKLLGGGKSGT